MTVQILGAGCTKCRRLEEKVKAIIDMNSINAEVEKVTDLSQMLKFNIMTTPALVINGNLKSAGMIPRDEQILIWLTGG